MHQPDVVFVFPGFAGLRYSDIEREAERGICVQPDRLWCQYFGTTNCIVYGKRFHNRFMVLRRRIWGVSGVSVNLVSKINSLREP